MPELPEVEIIRYQLRHLNHKKISKIRVLTDFRLPELAALEKETIKWVYRHGKRLFIEFSDLVLMVHLGMSGNLRLVSRVHGRSLQVNKHDHFYFQFHTGSYLVYSDPRRFGKIELLTKDKVIELWHCADYLVGLPYYRQGPDALCWNLVNESALKRAVIWEEIYTRGITNRPIKAALLDQSKIAGFGNIYTDELLFLCKIHPKRLCKSLSLAEYRRLAEAAPNLLQFAIQAGGSTIKGSHKYVSTAGQEGEMQLSHSVYGRANKKCKVCNKRLSLSKVANRTTVYCKTCQPYKISL